MSMSFKSVLISVLTKTFESVWLFPFELRTIKHTFCNCKGLSEMLGEHFMDFSRKGPVKFANAKNKALRHVVRVISDSHHEPLKQNSKNRQVRIITHYVLTYSILNHNTVYSMLMKR